MRATKWARRIALAVAGSSLLVVGLTVGASASTVTFASALGKGQTTVVVGCSGGEQFVSGTAQWYKREGAKVASTSSGTVAPSDPSSGVYTVPKGAKFVSITQECEPIPTETTFTQTGPGTGSAFSVDCPANYPYLRSVFEVVVDNDGDFSTTGDQHRPFYTTTDTGVFVEGVSTANYWRVSLYCSSLPQH